MQITSEEMKEIYDFLHLQAHAYRIGDVYPEKIRGNFYSDLASDAFTRGLERIDGFVAPEGDRAIQIRALKGWFKRIMKNMYLDKIKSADTQRVDRRTSSDELNVDRSSDELNIASPTSRPEPEAIQDDLANKLWQLCKEILSPRENEILFLFMNGYKYREIADQLGITTNSVGAKIANAKLKLKERIDNFEELLGSV